MADDGSLMLVGAYEDWQRLLAALDTTHELTIDVLALPPTRTTRPVAEVTLTPLKTREACTTTSSAPPPTAGILDGDRVTVFALDRFQSLSEELRQILEYNDADELATRGWHAHFDLNPALELPNNPHGQRLTEIMLSGPNWQ